jgi:hypothetical protein
MEILDTRSDEAIASRPADGPTPRPTQAGPCVTLAQTATLKADDPHGDRAHVAYARFLNAYYRADRETRRAMLADEPVPTGDAVEDAFAGAVAEYLSKQYGLAPPAWASAHHRFLDTPWFAGGIAAPGFREYLMWASPAEFRSRNLFTEERPLRRASQWQADQAMQAERAARIAARAAAAPAGPSAERPMPPPAANG